MNQSLVLSQKDDNEDLFGESFISQPPQMVKYPSFAPLQTFSEPVQVNQTVTVQIQEAEQPKLLGSMLDGMGLALGDAESDDDLFGNKKDEKKNENEADW